jgi:hypothetical protein
MTFNIDLNYIILQTVTTSDINLNSPIRQNYNLLSANVSVIPSIRVLSKYVIVTK